MHSNYVNPLAFAAKLRFAGQGRRSKAASQLHVSFPKESITCNQWDRGKA